jgi:hypothetical protein
MGRKIPVEGHQNLVRDANSGAILNINTKAIEDARKAKANRKKDKERIERLEEKVEQMGDTLTSIEMLLKEALKKNV